MDLEEADGEGVKKDRKNLCIDKHLSGNSRKTTTTFACDTIFFFSVF